jgi:hypothetical protein
MRLYGIHKFFQRWLQSGTSKMVQQTQLFLVNLQRVAAKQDPEHLVALQTLMVIYNNWGYLTGLG